jgi:hypothetical protein
MLRKAIWKGLWKMKAERLRQRVKTLHPTTFKGRFAVAQLVWLLNSSTVDRVSLTNKVANKTELSMFSMCRSKERYVSARGG